MLSIHLLTQFVRLLVVFGTTNAVLLFFLSLAPRRLALFNNEVYYASRSILDGPNSMRASLAATNGAQKRTCRDGLN